MAENKLKSNKFGNVYSDKMLAFPVGRVYFVNLARPSAQYNKYQLTVLYPKDDKAILPALKALKADYIRLATFKYGNAEGIKALTHPAIYDGDTATVSAEDGTLLCTKYKEFKGCYYIRISNSDPIRCIDSNKKDIAPKGISPGMKVDGVVQGMLFDKGVSWKGLVVRLVEDDGTRYYTGPDPTTMLKALGGEDVTEEEVADVLENTPEAAPAKKTGKSAAADLL